MRNSRAATPRFHTRRRPERKTLGGRVAKFAEKLGTPMMPWQRAVADVGLELVDGHLAYREIVVTVPRQQGKTTLVLSVEADVCVNRAPAFVVYTAQTGADARAKLLDEHVPALLDSPLRQLVDKVNRAKGAEGVRWTNGSRIGLNAGTESSGHGVVVDAGFIDEAFKDVDDRREQSILPAMVTKRDGQMWVVSTQGTSASLYLNRKCELGRQSVVEDSGRGVCYVEFSALPDQDPADPATWRSCMPALGITIDESSVRHAFESMDLPDFMRSMLNVQHSSTVDQPIPGDVWARVQAEDASPAGGLVLGVEAAIDRSWSALVVADVSGRVEVVDYRAGTGWVPDRVKDLVKSHGCRVVLDSRGPGRGFVQPLKAAGVGVTELSTSEMAAATLGFVDAVAGGQVAVRPHEALTAAVDAGRRRWSGDQWFFTRKNTLSDVSPLVAAAMAVFVAVQPAVEERVSGEPELLVL